jgi:DNA invertase Pin-like site-specific DNA recombinase
VSTTDQDLAVQRQALALAGVGVIFEEKASGTKREGRTELQKVLRSWAKAMHLSSTASTAWGGPYTILPTSPTR